MFNPFRKNSKVPDLTPTLWEKIRLRTYMVWVALRVLGTRINVGKTLTAAMYAIVIAGAAYGIYRFNKHMATVNADYQFHWQNDPCIAFANETANHVPLRCLPGSPVPDKR